MKDTRAVKTRVVFIGAALLLVGGIAGALVSSATGARAVSGQEPAVDGATTVLQQLADQMASTNGDITPLSEDYVQTNRIAALDATEPGDAVAGAESSQAVYLVRIAGDFTGYGAKVPEGSATPKGSYIYLIIDQNTLTIMDWSLTNLAVDLGKLGTAYSLK